MSKLYTAVETDILVVGSEGAGARAGIEGRFNSLDTIIVTKGSIGRSGATMTAGADFTVDGKSANEYCRLPGDMRDSPTRYFEDIVRDGLFLSNQKMVEAYVEGCPIIVKEMIDWGMRVDGYEKVHSEAYARGLLTTGKEIVRVLKKQSKKVGVKVIEDTVITDILMHDSRVAGAVGIDMRTGDIIVIRACAVILATGGWQMAYPFTDATSELTGDGHGMVYRCGGELVDMEMVQFAPGTVLGPPMYRGNIGPMVYCVMSGQGQLLNNRGERFMEKYDSRLLERSTKEVICIATEKEVAEGRGSPLGGVYFSMKHIPTNIIEDVLARGTGLFAAGGKWTERGFPDIVELLKKGYAIEVGSSSHFMMGGIRVNENGETSIPGLYAAGECSGGLWGANRVASAISQVIVQGRQCGRSASKFVKENKKVDIDNVQCDLYVNRLLLPLGKKKGAQPVKVKREIQQIAGKTVGVIRNRISMEKGLKEIEEIGKDVLPDLCVSSTKSRKYNQEWVDALQLENMCICISSSLNAALEREESRGAHYREDLPYINNDEWARNIVIRFDGKNRVARVDPVVKTSVEAPTGKMSYEESIGVATSSLET